MFTGRKAAATGNCEELMRKLSCVRAVDMDEAGDLSLLGSDVLVLPAIRESLARWITSRLCRGINFQFGENGEFFNELMVEDAISNLLN